MEAQTLAFALVAALYPVGLLAITFLLASDRPMRLGLSFLAGAATSLFVVGVLVITVLQGAGLNDSDADSARGGFRIGFGTAMLVAAWLLSRRPRPQAKAEPSWKLRLRGARPMAVFITGAILYAPSGSYLAAVQQIATSDAGLPWGVQLLVVIAIVLITVEVPLLSYALKPEATARVLRRAERWLDLHGRQALVAVLAGIGIYLIVDGIVILAG
jgi:Sap, sulfolipid-1-addressing protein